MAASEQPLFDRMVAASEELRGRLGRAPKIAWLAEGGLGPLERRRVAGASRDASDLPGFAPGSPGRFLRLAIDARTEIVAFEGGVLLADGAAPEDVALPVWILAHLGAEVCILTGGASALEPSLDVPSLLGVEDHWNLGGATPLPAQADERFGPRYPDLAQAYDGTLLARATRHAARLGIPFRAGVLAASRGPSLETFAERSFLRTTGAHAVAQSIVVPALAAAHAGLSTLALAGIVEGVRGRGRFADPAAMARAAVVVADQTARLVEALAPELASTP